MSYYVSCFPQSDLLTGSLILKENQESPLPLANVMFCLGSTILYPVILAITTLSELYLVIDYASSKLKDWKLEKKITQLQTASDSELETIKDQRLKKLQIRKNKLQNEISKAINLATPYFTSKTTEPPPAKIKEAYLKAKEMHETNDPKFSYLALSFWEDKFKPFQAWNRVDAELKNYQNKSTVELKEIFLKKREFSQIRNLLRQHVDLHYLGNLFIMQIPVIGLMRSVHSKYTTKVSLEKTDLVDRYENALFNYKWLKPY